MFFYVKVGVSNKGINISPSFSLLSEEVQRAIIDKMIFVADKKREVKRLRALIKK